MPGSVHYAACVEIAIDVVLADLQLHRLCAWSQMVGDGRFSVASPTSTNSLDGIFARGIVTKTYAQVQCRGPVAHVAHIPGASFGRICSRPCVRQGQTGSDLRHQLLNLGIPLKLLLSWSAGRHDTDRVHAAHAALRPLRAARVSAVGPIAAHGVQRALGGLPRRASAHARAQLDPGERLPRIIERS